jgi:hypothetical protein
MGGYIINSVEDDRRNCAYIIVELCRVILVNELSTPSIGLNFGVYVVGAWVEWDHSCLWSSTARLKKKSFDMLGRSRVP